MGFFQNRRYRKKFESTLSSLALLHSQVTGNQGMTRQKMVIAHIHYPNTWKDLRTAILRINPDSIIVTTTCGADFISTLRNDFPRAHIVQVQNRGRDIYPLIRLAQEGVFEDPSIVYKIHGKRSRHLLNGANWRRDLLFSISGTPEIANSVATLLEGSSNSLIGDDRYLREMDEGRVVSNNVYTDWANSNNLKLNVVGVRYIEGSIFACKSEVLNELSKIHFGDESFTLEGEHQVNLGFFFALRLFLLGKLSNIGLFKTKHENIDLLTRPASSATYAMEAYIGFLARKFGEVAGILTMLQNRDL
jgi:hypothetical protein